MATTNSNVGTTSLPLGEGMREESRQLAQVSIKRSYQETTSCSSSSSKRSRTVDSITATTTATTTTCGGDNTMELRVPSIEYPTLELAVTFANEEFARAAAAAAALNQDQEHSQPTTITIQIDPSPSPSTSDSYSYSPPCYEIEKSLVVNAAGKDARLIIASAAGDPNPLDLKQNGWPCGNQVHLSMETAVANQPLIRLVAGHLELHNLSLDHYSRVDVMALMRSGHENKNSNAAILVDRTATGTATYQQQQQQQQKASPSSPIHVFMKNVVITSYSGKAIMNRNPSCEIVKDQCYVANLIAP